MPVWNAAQKVLVPIALVSAGLTVTLLGVEIALRAIDYNPMEAVA